MAKVGDLLSAKGSAIYAISPDDPVLNAVQIMADKSIGSLLVMRGDELLGIVSERDYARKIVLKGRSSAETPVWQVMSAPVRTVTREDSATTCMMLMTELKIRHLPVVEHGKVLGVVSIGDLVKAVIEEQQREIEQLQHYIAS